MTIARFAADLEALYRLLDTDTMKRIQRDTIEVYDRLSASFVGSEGISRLIAEHERISRIANELSQRQATCLRPHTLSSIYRVPDEGRARRRTIVRREVTRKIGFKP
jgi:hypothetical protein